MSHKNKICNTALATHIETCHPAYTYAPLVIDRRRWATYDQAEPRGLPAVVAAELAEKVEPKIAKSCDAIPCAEEVSQKLLSGNAALMKDLRKRIPDIDMRLQAALNGTVDEAKRETEATIAADITREAIADAGPALNLDRPDEAIAARERAVEAEMDMEKISAQEFQPVRYWGRHELRELGIFFCETVCYRPEGTAYAPCGEEFTLLPGESFTEKRAQSETTSDSATDTSSTATDVTNSTDTSNSQTLNESYENTVKREYDVGLSKESTVKASIPFQVLTLGLGSTTSGSFDFNKLVTEANKSSREDKRSLVRKVVHNLKTSTSASRTQTFKTTASSSYSRTVANDTDCARHFIERDQHCVYSVHHKRTNAQLAWSGCIDDPARDLCRPEDFEEDHAEEIQAIRDKWNVKVAPAEFGPRPANREMCTSWVTEEIKNGVRDPAIGYNDFGAKFQLNIPAGYTYASGSANIDIDNFQNLEIEDVVIDQQPTQSNGWQIITRVNAQNRRYRSDTLSWRVCYSLIPDEALQWDAKVKQWRDEQAQTEIDALRAEKEEQYNAYLLSDRVAATVEQRIFSDYFGVTDIQDCCRFIARVRSIFDFDKLSFSLLPSWSQGASHCQQSDPVTIYTALCLQFYLPVQEGKEWDALLLLISINAIPWNSHTASQIWGYVNAIRNMRDTLFNSQFDPDGWAEKVDDPCGYYLTPYDTDDCDEWDTAYESSMNYQLIDAHVITVPNGKRIDPRPALCDDGECSPGSGGTGGGCDDGSCDGSGGIGDAGGSSGDGGSDDGGSGDGGSGDGGSGDGDPKG